MADRFGMWGWTGVFGLGSITPAVWRSSPAATPTRPRTISWSACAGWRASVVLYFAFLPPAAYARFIRQNAPTPVPGQGP